MYTSLLKVLAVDDHRFMTKIVQQSLLTAGVNDVKFAFDAGEALRLLEENIFDVLITDIHMPKINGLELVKMIRSGESGAKRGLPAIMLTSNSDPAVIRLALLLDVSGFLVKPVSAKKITERLNTALVHPIDLKGPEYYLKLDLSKMYANEEDKTHAVSQKNMSRNSKNSGKKGVTRLDDVVAGMTLSSDLHGENQQMIQAAGTALTPDVLSLLLQI